MSRDKKGVAQGLALVDLLKKIRDARGLNNAWACAVDRAIETKDISEKSKPQKQHVREHWTGWC